MEPKIEYIGTMHKAAMVRLFEKSNTIAVDWHNHNEIEFVYIKKGTGNCMVGDKIIQYQPDDFFLLGPNVPHLFRSFDNSNEDERYIIQCSEKMFEGALFDLDDLRIIKNYLQKLSFGHVIHKNESKQFEKEIHSIYEATPFEAIFLLFLLMGKLAETEIGEPLSSLPYMKSVNKNTRTGQILSFILENIAIGLTVDKVADHMHMSKPALCNYFKKATGKRFSEFVNEVRINKACQMLKETDISIAEISYAVGYSNLSYFNRSFQKLKSLSPKQYRKNGFL